MKVYVVWFQDPIEPVAGLCAVFANKEEAEDYCETCTKTDKFGNHYYAEEMEVQ